MALNQAKLTASLLDIFANKGSSRTVEAFEEQWADAYDSYARDARDVSGDSLLLASPTGFRRSLNFRSCSQPQHIANQFEMAFQAYWTGAIFQIGIPPSPIPIGCPNVGGNTIFGVELTSMVILVTPQVVFGQMYPEFSVADRGDSISARATRIAAAMHMATTTAILVLISGLDTTVPTPLPITNTCRIS